MDQSRHPKIRRDGWTAQRQLRFLDMLSRIRNVTRAAVAVGMSRESAYRLRARRNGALFAIAWDRAMEGHSLVVRKPAAAPKIPENPPKVTKWKKWKTPRFNTLLDELCHL